MNSKSGSVAIRLAEAGDLAASVNLHAKFGFETVGHLKQIGFKFGRWLDAIHMELLL